MCCTASYKKKLYDTGAMLIRVGTRHASTHPSPIRATTMVSMTPTRSTRRKSPRAATCSSSRVVDCRRTLTCPQATCPTWDPSTHRQRLHTRAMCRGVANTCRLPVCHSTRNTSHRGTHRVCKKTFTTASNYLPIQHLAQPRTGLPEASMTWQTSPYPFVKPPFSTETICTPERDAFFILPDVSLAIAHAVWRLFGIGALSSTRSSALFSFFFFKLPRSFYYPISLFFFAEDTPRFNFDCASHAGAVSPLR